MPWHPTFTLVRADDHLVVDVTTVGLEPKPNPSDVRGAPPFLLHPAAGGGLLRFRLPPQQLLEYAADADGNAEPAGLPIFPDRSEIVVSVPAGTPPFPASVEGILDAARRLPLVVAEEPPAGQPTNVDQPGTRFDLPYLLRLRLPKRSLRLAHGTDAAEHAGRFGLWSSEVVIAPDDPGADRTLQVWFDELKQEPVAGPDSPTGVNTLNHTLTPAVVTDVARRSKLEKRVEAHDLRVSSLGGWADLRGSWPEPGLTDFAHRLSMGRDEAQRKGRTGRLMPFGHRAFLSSETLRRFESDESDEHRAAALLTEATITVRQRSVSLLPAAPAPGQPAPPDPSQGLPFTRVDIVTRATPPGKALAPTGAGDLAGRDIVVLHVHGEPFTFVMRGFDHAGQVVDFEMPLMFVPDPPPPVQGQPPPPPFIEDAQAIPLWGKQGDAFTTVPLRGQAMAVAPPTAADLARAGRTADTAAAGPSAGADAGAGTTTVAQADAAAAAVAAEPLPASLVPATSVLAETLKLAPTPAGFTGKVGHLYADTITGVVPTLDRFAPDVGAVAVKYADQYLTNGFEGDNAEHQVFLKMGQDLKRDALSLAGKATGGMAQLNLPVTAFARERGAVVGAVENLFAQKPDLGFLQQSLTEPIPGVPDIPKFPKLLGVVDLKDLIPADLVRPLSEAPEIFSDVVEGKVTKDLTWTTRLFNPDDITNQNDPKNRYRKGRIRIRPFIPAGAAPDFRPKLTIRQSTTVDAAKEQLHSRTECEVVGFELQILDKEADDGTALISVPFKKFSFVATDGTKPDVDVKLGPLRFGGILSFLGRLIDLLDMEGFSDPPALVVTDDSVKSSFSFPVPSLAIGAFTLQNISIGAELEIFFAEKAPTLFVYFSRESNPFQLTVSALGGGGFLELGVSTGGLEHVKGGLEFGAAAAIDIIVASVSVEVMGGVTFRYDAVEGVAFEAYVRLRGHVDIASLISADILLLLILKYEQQDNLLIGHGELVLSIKVLFFSESLRVSVTRTFAGANADPTFAELMAPADDPGPRPWDIYCTTFMKD